MNSQVCDKPELNGAAGNSGQERLKILVVHTHIPYPPHLGASDRIFNLMKRMAGQADVYLLCLSDERLLHQAEPLRRYCRGIDVLTRKAQRTRLEQISLLLRPTEWPRLLKRSLMLLRGYPPETVSWHYPEFAEKMATIVEREKIDIVQFEFITMGQYVLDLKKRCSAAGAHCPKYVLIEHDITSVYLRRKLHCLTGAQKAACAVNFLLYAKLEKKLLPLFDYVFAMSEIDAAKLRDKHKTMGPVGINKNGVDVEKYTPAGKPTKKPALAFLGSTQIFPNRDGLEWFLRNVFPRVERDFPGTVLNVIGEYDRARVQARRNVRYHGVVADLEDVMRGDFVFVCPLRFGAGTRLKIVIAMAFGLPVISTSVGAEGISARTDEGLVVADDAPGMAQAIAGLLSNAEKRSHYGKAARAFVERHYAWNGIAADLIRHYEALASPEKEG